MTESSGFYLAFFIPPLLVTLIGQIFILQDRPGVLIVRAATLWAALATLMTDSTGGDVPERLMATAMTLVIGLVLAFAGAIVGSELSPLLARLLRKTTG